MIAGPRDATGGDPRLELLRELARQFGTELPHGLVVRGEHTRAAGAEGFGELMSRRHPPDAVFCANDVIAVGAMDRAEELDVRIPGDVALVGYDDAVFASLVRPRLTTIRYPAQAAGRPLPDCCGSGSTGGPCPGRCGSRPSSSPASPSDRRRRAVPPVCHDGRAAPVGGSLRNRLRDVLAPLDPADGAASMQVEALNGGWRQRSSARGSVTFFVDTLDLLRIVLGRFPPCGSRPSAPRSTPMAIHRRFPRSRRAGACGAVLALTVLTGCGGGGAAPTVPMPRSAARVREGLARVLVLGARHGQGGGAVEQPEPRRPGHGEDGAGATRARTRTCPTP
ncbi:substrate-binding domain-containing protein [Kitasatospora arboriphila]